MALVEAMMTQSRKGSGVVFWMPLKLLELKAMSDGRSMALV
jgi:hypothetical protein